MCVRAQACGGNGLIISRHSAEGIKTCGSGMLRVCAGLYTTCHALTWVLAICVHGVILHVLCLAWV
jgi:hypothetical protein